MIDSLICHPNIFNIPETMFFGKVNIVKILLIQLSEFHSDRGCQYTSYAFRRTLVSAGLIQSLSGTAHCYDNARMESFFATLKKEKLYQLPPYRMKREEVKTAIFRYIFGYYNTQRINSFNKDGLPPVALRSSTELAHHAA